jgi:predicted type IV restriction endonuclease
MREAPCTTARRHDQEESVQGLLDTLKQCVERLDRYRRPSQRVGESNTKAGLIEPIIAALGWDVLDPDEVHREYRRRPADNPVDYALLLSRTPRLFIEAKGLGEPHVVAGTQHGTICRLRRGAPIQAVADTSPLLSSSSLA